MKIKSLDQYKPQLIEVEKNQLEVLRKNYGGKQESSGFLSKKEMDRYSKGLKILLDTFIHNPGQKDFHYLMSPVARSAYLLHYLMPNIQRWLHLLDMSEFQVNWTDNKPLRILDFGAGPASSTIGFLIFLCHYMNFKILKPIEVELLDFNANIIKDGKYLIESFAKNNNLDVKVFLNGGSQSRHKHEKPFDIILMGNVWNESLSSHENARSRQIEDWLSQYRSVFAENTKLLIMEPANRRSSRLLMGFRDYFALHGDGFLKILAPCPKGMDGKPCVLNRLPNRPWCHFGFKPLRLDLFDKCIAYSGFQNDSLSYSYLIMGLHGKATAEGRVISNKMKISKEFGCYVCHREGRVTLGPYEEKKIPLKGSAVKKELKITDNGREKRAKFKTFHPSNKPDFKGKPKVKTAPKISNSKLKYNKFKRGPKKKNDGGSKTSN